MCAFIGLALHSDDGKEFTVKVHQQVYDLLKIHHLNSTPYKPHANGAVVRCNWTLLATLRAVPSILVTP